MKHNPGFLSEKDLLKTFVVRQDDLNTIVDYINKSQHVLLTGDNGSGKTTLTLRLAIEMKKNPELNKKWYSIMFNEENYTIATVGEIWLETLLKLFEQTNDERWYEAFKSISKEKEEIQLHNLALTQLINFANEQEKQLLIIIENLNTLFEEQLSNNSIKLINHTLRNEPKIKLIGTSTNNFDRNKEIYSTFNCHYLPPLSDFDCKKIWSFETGNNIDIEKARPIRILTGGTLRHITTFSSLSDNASFPSLINDFTRLLDENTTHFKNNLEKLPPLERKIISVLANIWDPATARDVAITARVDINKTSSILNRLVNRGEVSIVREKSRKKSYELSNRMDNIYHLIKRKGLSSNRTKAIINFMSAFYGKTKLTTTSKFAEEASKFDSHLFMDQSWKFKQALIKTNRATNRKGNISNDNNNQPHKNDHFSIYSNLTSENPSDQVNELFERVTELKEKPGKEHLSIELLNKIISINPNRYEAYLEIGHLYYRADQEENAENAYNKCLQIKKDSTEALDHLGDLYLKTLRYKEAESTYRKSIDISPLNGYALYQMVNLLDQTKRTEEAIELLKKAKENQSINKVVFIGKLGDLYTKLGLISNAEKLYREVVLLDPHNRPIAWCRLGDLYAANPKRLKEAENAYKTALGLCPSNDSTSARLGVFYDFMEDYNSALQAFRQALKIKPDSPFYKMLIALELGKLNQWNEAFIIADEILSLKTVTTQPSTTIIDFIILASSNGYTKKLQTLIQKPNYAIMYEPILVALSLLEGKDVNIAREILQVAQDIVNLVNNKKQKIVSKGPEDILKVV